MPRRRSETVEFRVEDTAAVVAAMDRLAAAHGGWINLHPVVREEDEPPQRGLGTLLLAGAVHDVPVCTWVAGKVTRKGVAPDSIGVQHAAGTRVRARIDAAGVPIPAGWRLVQDHARRGLVVHPDPAQPHAEVLDWLLEVGSVLSAVRLTGDWRAQVFPPRS